MLNFASICPHPPIIIPTVSSHPQRKKCRSTIRALKKLGEKFQAENPEELIIISPHLPFNSESFSLYKGPKFKGNLSQFGAPQTKFSYPAGVKLKDKIKDSAENKGLPIREERVKSLDHGSLVPLFYLTGPGKKQVKILPLAFSDLDYNTHFQLGKIIGDIIAGSDKKIGVCASGDLSHRLKPEAPAGFHPEAQEFDKKLTTFLKNKNNQGIINMEPALIKKAGECGLRSVIILLGVLTNFDWNPRIISYEAPFGVGYLVADFEILTKSN